MKFSEYRISPEIKKSLELLVFKKPTDIQYKAIPPILKGEDVLAIAQTGTGKTAAFAIPIIHLINEGKKKSKNTGIKCLVMAPTHELAIQINEVFKSIAKFSRIKTFALFGGTDQDHQIEQLASGIDILVTTPGRMFDLRSQGHLDLSTVEILVLDEADHMLDLGFIDDIKDVLRYLSKDRQTLFFSATINDKIKKLAYSLVRNAIRIQISPKDPVSKNIVHSLVYVEMDDKRFFLERIIKENPGKKMIVFVRTKVRAERVMLAMKRVALESRTIHSGKEHMERKVVMEAFKNDEVKVLIATDVSARGIDIPNVDLVVNYDLPDVAENYVHRVGRTGRGMAKGQALAFCAKEEKEYLDAIEEYLGGHIEVLELDKEVYKETLDFTKTESNTTWKDIQREISMHEESSAKYKKKKQKAKLKKNNKK
ncbi:MAG: ATP-dependent RNA helicase RhlE [Algoriphagus sp.]|jgi:ATP-dependent RNA helicase RhlE